MSGNRCPSPVLTLTRGSRERQQAPGGARPLPQLFGRCLSHLTNTCTSTTFEADLFRKQNERKYPSQPRCLSTTRKLSSRLASLLPEVDGNSGRGGRRRDKTADYLTFVHLQARPVQQDFWLLTSECSSADSTEKPKYKIFRKCQRDGH